MAPGINKASWIPGPFNSPQQLLVIFRRVHDIEHVAAAGLQRLFLLQMVVGLAALRLYGYEICALCGLPKVQRNQLRQQPDTLELQKSR